MKLLGLSQFDNFDIADLAGAKNMIGSVSHHFPDIWSLLRVDRYFRIYVITK